MQIAHRSKVSKAHPAQWSHQYKQQSAKGTQPMAKQYGIKSRKRQQSDQVKMRKRAQEKKLHQRWYCYPTMAEAREQNMRVLRERTQQSVRVTRSITELDHYWDHHYAGRI